MKKNRLLVVALFIITINYAQTIIYSEDFNTNVNPEWINYNYGETPSSSWDFGSGTMPGPLADFTTNAAIFNDGANGDNGVHSIVMLIKHNLNISSLEQIELTFDYALAIYGSDWSQKLTVKLWDETTSNWVGIAAYGSSISPTSISIDLTPFLLANPGISRDSLSIGFEYDDIDGSWGYGAGIDNVVLKGYELPDNDSIFIHTVTTENQILNLTVIDHPDLNNNPVARIITSQISQANGSTEVTNDNFTGVWYTGTNWVIYNENNSSMPVGTKYAVYISGKDSETITHIANTESQGDFIYQTVIDNPLINANPNAKLILTNYFNSHTIYNNNPYGVYYNNTIQKWVIYNENLTSIPLNAAFNIVLEASNNMNAFKYLINDLPNPSFALINSSGLNNNPNATFVFTHDFGGNGAITNVFVNKSQYVFYDTNTNFWYLSNVDGSDLVLNSMYNFVVDTRNTATITNNEIIDFKMYPNPVNSILNIETQEEIIKASIYNLLGEEIKNVLPNASSFNINIKSLNAGIYILKLISNKVETSKRFLKD